VDRWIWLDENVNNLKELTFKWPSAMIRDKKLHTFCMKNHFHAKNESSSIEFEQWWRKNVRQTWWYIEGAVSDLRLSIQSTLLFQTQLLIQICILGRIHLLSKLVFWPPSSNWSVQLNLLITCLQKSNDISIYWISISDYVWKSEKSIT
jgi:hypothetical protein